MSRRGAEQKRKALHDEAQSAGEKKTEAQSTNARETRGAEQVAARMLSETFSCSRVGVGQRHPKLK